MENQDFITIRGAREHNLQGVDVRIPKNKLVVLSGVSGSGKSSLAMDTLYAEGQRRYVESLSSYARQFLGMMKRPEVDSIEGLSPAIAIDQHGLSHNPRSTVGTVTEIYDYMRVLYARIGHPHCPNCNREIAHQTSETITRQILETFTKKLGTNQTARFMVLSPVVRDKRGEFTGFFANLKKKGFEQVRIDGRIYALKEDVVLIKTNRHNIEVVVDKFNLIRNDYSVDAYHQRVTDAVEIALELADGFAILTEVTDEGFTFPDKPEKMTDLLFSKRFVCPDCNLSLPDIEPRLFSFNSPQGACPKCEGIGAILQINPEKIINPNISILEGGIIPWAKRFETDSWTLTFLENVANKYKFSLNTQINQLPKEIINLLLWGEKGVRGLGYNKGFEGVANNLERRYRETDSDYIKQEIERYMYRETCPECHGARLKKDALSITVAQLNISQATDLNLELFFTWIKDVINKLETDREKEIAKGLIKEIESRINFLLSVGVEYLTLGRTASTLSVGEAQRIRLASQIGTGLTGVLYVLDEPTVGLHQRDTQKLIITLKRLRDLGNTVVVVEHDNEVLEAADWIIDFGPGAGKKGGQVIAEGTPDEIKANPKSITGQYLSGKRNIRAINGDQLSVISNQNLMITGCKEHNLKNITVEFPLRKFNAITGVSGSGKSTLMHDTLYPAIKKALAEDTTEKPGAYDQIANVRQIAQVLLVDQSPIGQTSRSNPATYTSVFTDIRELFALTEEARFRGFSASRFSFNIEGGRCEACQGQGSVRVEMQFLADVWVECEVCRGTRFKQEVLEVEYKEKNIHQVLKLTVDEAFDFFNAYPKITKKLEVLRRIGLGYLELGQASPTLSGGESQRLKLARELVKSGTSHTLYLLDEPTTGLHFADVERLLTVIRELINRGSTVIVIEHNLDIIKNADWIIDLGPEGGEKGGEVVAKGTPVEVAKSTKSYTGRYLKKVIGG